MLEQCAALCLHLPVIPEEACVLAVSSFASASAVWEGKGRLFASSGVVASGQHRAHAIIATRCDARGSFCPHPACALLASESMPAPRIPHWKIILGDREAGVPWPSPPGTVP
jgi:hypothetical protein